MLVLVLVMVLIKKPWSDPGLLPEYIKQTKEQLLKELLSIFYCRPVSRILSGAIIYLVPPLLTESICLPSPIFRRSFAGQAKDRGIHSISAPKVYPLCKLLCIIVSSYLTFSPLSRFAARRLFSVALSVAAKATPGC